MSALSPKSFAFLSVIFVVTTAAAQTVYVEPGVEWQASFDGATIGVPGALGGCEFDATGSVLYIGGYANNASGAIYALPVLRDGTGTIIGFGAASFWHTAPYIDGGLAFAGGATFYTTYSNNTLGVIAGTAHATYGLPSFLGSTGSCAFIPAGPLAGTFLIASYVMGPIYTASLTLQPDGTSVPGNLFPFAMLGSGTEGIRVIPAGPYAGDLLVADYSYGTLSRIPIDPSTGYPVGGTSTPAPVLLASWVFGAEGVAFDPVTGDMIASTFGPNAIHRFSLPALPLAATPEGIPLAGASVRFDIRAGTANAGRPYVLVGSASGTTPGTPVGTIVVPLNLNFLTLLVLDYLNTPLFMDFAGATDAGGAATATLNLPALPSTFLGFTASWAYVLLSPEDYASNPVTTIIVP